MTEAHFEAHANWTYLATLALLVREGKAKLGTPGPIGASATSAGGGAVFDLLLGRDRNLRRRVCTRVRTGAGRVVEMNGEPFTPRG